MSTDRKQQRRTLILTQLKTPASAEELLKATSIKRATLFRDLEFLILQGLIVHEGELYRASALAQEKKTVIPSSSPVLSALAQLWPWLALMPTPLHAAVAKLALFCQAARQNRLSGDRHPALMLLGPTMRLKSWLAKALCWLCGSSPERCGLAAGQVRSRGLLARLNAIGACQYENSQLKEPFLWLEELSLADAAVSRDFLALIHGPREVRIESQIIDVQAVTLAELNDLKRSDKLEERLGLRPERIRRTFVADFSTVNIPRSMRTQAGIRLDRIKVSAPVKQLRACEPADRHLECIERFIEEAVNPDAVDYVDPGRVITAFQGACCFLTPDEALLETLMSWGELAESTRFLRADWRATLFRISRSPTVSDGPADPPCDASVRIETSETSNAKEPAMNPYILEDNIAELRRLMIKAGWRLPEDQYDLERFLRELREAISTSSGLLELIREPHVLATMLKLAHELANRGLDTEKLKELLKFHGWFVQQNLDLAVLNNFVDEVERFKGLGVSVNDAAHFIQHAFSLCQGEDAVCTTRQLVNAISDYNLLGPQLDSLRKELAMLQSEIAILKAEKDFWESPAGRSELH